jgi:thioester reductase-like protein
MNHLEPYWMAKPTNVGGARELLSLANSKRLKLVNYISTLSVFSAMGADRTRIVDERTSTLNEKHSISQGYAASKWVGENIFMAAGDHGIPCNIFRVGLVWADSQKGRYDELQREFRVLKSCLISGHGIKDYCYAMPATPVDYVARAIAYLGRRFRDGRGIFHISSTGAKIDGLFERCNEIAGIDLELLSYYQWIAQIKRLHQGGVSLPIVPLLEFAFSMNEESFNRHYAEELSSSVKFDCTSTHTELERAGIPAPMLDDSLLKACLDDMMFRDVELRRLFDQPLRKYPRQRRNG